jgi:hypothetical protein
LFSLYFFDPPDCGKLTDHRSIGSAKKSDKKNAVLPSEHAFLQR